MSDKDKYKFNPALDVTEEEHNLMVSVAEYQHAKQSCGFSHDDIETRILEIIHIASGGKINLER